MLPSRIPSRASRTLLLLILPSAFFYSQAALSQPAPAPSNPISALALIQEDFEQGLKNWTPQGKAEFAADSDHPHAGRQCARIVIAASEKPAYQQLQRVIRDDIRAGDNYEGTVWVRAKGLTGTGSAYAYLEFLGAKDARIEIVHSQFNPTQGLKGWERLTMAGVAPKGVTAIRVGMVLHANGTAWFDDAELRRTLRETPWPDLGAAERAITIRAHSVIHPRFGGVGFHVFDHAFSITPEIREQVIAKRWRELNPSFARMNDQWDWGAVSRNRMAEYILRLKQDTSTEIYVTTWNPKQTATDAERAAYAKKVVDNLEYLIGEKGLTNIKSYCMTNELSLGEWGKLAGDMPKFRAYHQALYDELRARKLDVQLLASDASPISYWQTIQWAADNMDAITGVYGGHHYINDWALENERFYPWFLSKMQWGASLARGKNKNFILGEFGSKQDGRTLNGVKMDVCVYYGTPQEPLVGIQVAEAVIAAMNAGVYAMGYWTYADFPDSYSKTYHNKWGLFKWSGNDFTPRSIYFAYGLFTKFFRGPASVLQTETNDPRLRVAALRHEGKGTISIAIVNRNAKGVPIALTLDGAPLNAAFRKYIYDSARPPQHPFGDLQDPVGKVSMNNGRLTDTIGAGCLAVFTTAYDDEPPAPVKGVHLEKSTSQTEKDVLKWAPSNAADFCYYRVFRSAKADFLPSAESQIGSTIATEFPLAKSSSDSQSFFKVLAIDQSGNASRAE